MTVPGYRLASILGTGQTSIVYLATDTQNREVALKVPKPDVLRDPITARMFANEVALSKVLQHDRIVPCYEGVASGPSAHLTMRYFPEGPLNLAGLTFIPQILRILADIAAALEYAHNKRIVHQDVKPGNIFMHEGRAYLADFGSASSEALSHQVAGSPFYMAPELLMGERGTPRSDMYSLGVCAYEFLTGQRPFLGLDLDELIGAHLGHQPPPVRTVRRDTPKIVGHLVDRALLKDPALRPTATQLREACETALEQPVEEAPARESLPRKLEVASVRLTPGAMRAKEEPRSFWDRVFRRKK